MMINKKIIILLFFLIFNIELSNIKALENKIFFKVNNEIITSVDIYNQTKYFKSINKSIQNLTDQEIFEISKKTLLKEKIKKDELLKNGIKLELDDKFLDPFIKSSFSSININNLSEYKVLIDLLNINFETMKEKLIIELLWNDLIVKKFSSKIRIDKNKLKQKIIADKNIDETSYLLNEIIFTVNDKSNIDKEYQFIKNSIIEKGFKNTALIYSIGDTAKDGGEIGWIKKNSLSENINSYLANLKKGQYSKPILIPGGFLILKIADIKKTKKNFNLEQELKASIRISSNQQLNQFSIMHFNRVKKNIKINEL